MKNLVQVNRALSMHERAWDALCDVVDIGDVDGNPWTIDVDVERHVHYHQIDVAPKYYLRKGGLYDVLSSRVTTNPYVVQPGVIRDSEYVAKPEFHDSWLTDARDIYVEEVKVNEFGTLLLKTGFYGEAEILADRLEYLYSLEGPKRPEEEKR